LRRGLVLSLALATCVAGAGLGLAQEVGGNTTAAPWVTPPAPGSPPSPAVAPPTASPDTLQAPPDEAAPPLQSAPPAAAEADTSAQPVVPETPPVPPPPPKRPRYGVAVLQALDKVSAQTLRFEAKVNEPVRYKDLVITVHACETSAADEPASDSVAHLEVTDQPDVLPGRSPKVARQVFLGWMFANAPGLHPFENPIYDVWVIACKTPAPAPAATAADPSL
jgi:hypothetical protein